MNDQNFVSKRLEVVLKAALIFVAIYLSYLILKPFLLVLVWAAIIAMSIYPLHLRGTKLLKGREKLSASIVVLVLLLVFILPLVLASDSMVESIKGLALQVKENGFVMPPPTDPVKDVPLVGNWLYDFWNDAYVSISDVLLMYKPQLLSFGEWLWEAASGVLSSIVVLLLSVLVSGVLLVNADAVSEVSQKVFRKVVGENGPQMYKNAKDTITSVVYGVLGTALIQSALISLGFFVADVPGATLLSVVVFLMALVQLPTIIVVLPVVLYMLTVLSGFGSVLFIVWCIVASLSDNFLKPILLGRGVEIPMIVILLGSIGGVMLMGLIGLFIGAVVLALSYGLFKMWTDVSSKF